MIRIVVAFLVAFQSLVPPGMCLCQFVPCEINPRLAKESAAEPCCSCAARQSPAPIPSDDQTTPKRETPLEHPCPHPTPGEPWPGCPVVSASPEARAAILPAPEQVAHDACFVVLTDELTRSRIDRREPLVVLPGTSLFLRHCALLI